MLARDSVKDTTKTCRICRFLVLVNRPGQIGLLCFLMNKTCPTPMESRCFMTISKQRDDNMRPGHASWQRPDYSRVRCRVVTFFTIQWQCTTYFFLERWNRYNPAPWWISLAAKHNRMIGNYGRENITTHTESHMYQKMCTASRDVQTVRKLVLGLGWPKTVLYLFILWLLSTQ